jgi:hypothetical protein
MLGEGVDYSRVHTYPHIRLLEMASGVGFPGNSRKQKLEEMSVRVRGSRFSFHENANLLREKVFIPQA